MPGLKASAIISRPPPELESMIIHTIAPLLSRSLAPGDQPFRSISKTLKLDPTVGNLVYLRGLQIGVVEHLKFIGNFDPAFERAIKLS